MTGTTGMRCRRRRWSWSMCAPSRWASPRRRRRRRSRAGRPPPRAVAAVAPGWPRRPPSPTPTSSAARRSAPARGSRGPRSSRCRPRRSWWRRASPSRSIGTARSWWRDDETSCVKPEARHGCAGARPSDGGCGGPYRGPPRRSMRRAGRRALQATVIAATLLFAAPAVAGESLDVAWLRGGVAEYIRLVGPAPGEILAAPPAATPLDRRLETSLGSIWKLFVYVYLSERDLAAPDYTCDGSAPKDEAFCCAPGSTVGVDQALACSCGLFFAPSRLNVTAEDWRVFWGGRTLPRDAAWLLDLSRVVPDTRVSVASLLAALAAVPPRGRQRAERALLDVVVAAQPLPARHLGATLRVKTWTWDDPTRAGTHAGGFAGWLADGTPVWG